MSSDTPASVYNVGFEIRGTAFLLSFVSASSLCYLEYLSYAPLQEKQWVTKGEDGGNGAKFSFDSFSLQQVVLLVVSWLGLVWSGIVTTFAGKVLYPQSFRVWQPFKGGKSFVVQQAFGWCLFFFSFVLSSTLLLDFGRTKSLSTGVYVSLAFLTLASQTLLNLSLDDFDPDYVVARTSMDLSQLLLRRDSAGLLGVHMLCLLFFVLVDLGTLQGEVVERGFGVAPWVAIGCIVASQYLVGFRGLGGFKLYRPFRGGVNFILLQAIGWSFFGMFCYLAVFIVNVNQPMPRGALSIYGLLSMASHLSLLESLQHYSAQATLKEAHPPNTSKSWLLKFVQVAAFASSGYFGLLVLQSRVGSQGKVDERVIAEQLVSFVLLSPLLHFSGYTCIEGYRLWQPLQGGVPFICLQGFGWFLYGCLIVTLCRSRSLFEDFDDFEIIGPLGVSSQLCLLVSLSQ